MKPFKLSSDSDLTMTVGELRTFLLRFPEEMPVVATWEGVSAGIREEDAVVKENRYYREKTLEIDVESY